MVKVKLEFKSGAPIETEMQAVPRVGELVAIHVGANLMTYEVKFVVHSKNIIRIVLMSPTYDASETDKG